MYTCVAYTCPFVLYFDQSDLYTCINMQNFSYISKQEFTEAAFEAIATIVFERGSSLIIGGNPAFDTECVLNHLEMVMTEWGYRSAKVAEYCDLIKKENDQLRAMGIGE